MILQLVIALLQQFRHRVFSEKLRGDALFRRFPGDGLGAVLAELEGGRVRFVRPGASGAVEAVRLVRVEQQRRRFGDVHLLGDCPGRRPQRAPSARGRVVAVHAWNVTFFHRSHQCLSESSVIFRKE